MEENRLSSISKADSDEKIGEIWDTHDLTEFDTDAPDAEFEVISTVPVQIKLLTEIDKQAAKRGVKVEVVSSNGEVLTKAINGGGPNPLCATAEQKAPIGLENQRVAGVLASYGKFRYLNLIDLDWEKEMELGCPVNKLGAVTVYQTSRHGAFDGAGAPAFLDAIKPQFVVVNNGPRKGMGQVDNGVKSITPGGPAQYEKVAYLRLAKIPGIEGIWQEHLSLLDPDPSHNTSPDMIANLEETSDCKGNWIKASVQPDGKFTVTNGEVANRVGDLAFPDGRPGNPVRMPLQTFKTQIRSFVNQ